VAGLIGSAVAYHDGSIDGPASATTYSEIFDETIFTTARLNITAHGHVYPT